MDAFVTADKVRRNFYADENTCLRFASDRSLEGQSIPTVETVYSESQFYQRVHGCKLAG